MSFSLQAAGKPTGVIAALQKSTGYGDTRHHDAARDAAVAIVQTIPAEQNDDTLVTVSGSGHHDFPVGAPGYGTVTLNVTIGPFLS